MSEVIEEQALEFPSKADFELSPWSKPSYWRNHGWPKCWVKVQEVRDGEKMIEQFEDFALGGTRIRVITPEGILTDSGEAYASAGGYIAMDRAYAGVGGEEGKYVISKVIGRAND